MSDLAKSHPSRVVLLNASVTALAVSDPVRRDNFVYHSLYAAHDDATSGASTVEIQACGRDPQQDSDWVTIHTGTVPFHANLSAYPIYAVRAKRTAGTRPLTVLINSGNYSR